MHTYFNKHGYGELVVRTPDKFPFEIEFIHKMPWKDKPHANVLYNAFILQNTD